MAEYIDRKELLRIEKLLDTDILRASKTASNIYDQMIYDIEHIPSADVAPVKHGKWIDREGPDEDLNVTDRCSVCWHSETHSPTVEVPYCWFCGAKMDLED